MILIVHRLGQSDVGVLILKVMLPMVDNLVRCEFFIRNLPFSVAQHRKKEVAQHVFLLSTFSVNLGFQTHIGYTIVMFFIIQTYSMLINLQFVVRRYSASGLFKRHLVSSYLMSGYRCTPPCGNPSLYTSYMAFFIHYIRGNFVQLRKMRGNSVTYTDKSFLSSSLLTDISYLPPTTGTFPTTTTTLPSEHFPHRFWRQTLRSTPSSQLRHQKAQIRHQPLSLPPTPNTQIGATTPNTGAKTRPIIIIIPRQRKKGREGDTLAKTRQ